MWCAVCVSYQDMHLIQHKACHQDLMTCGMCFVLYQVHTYHTYQDMHLLQHKAHAAMMMTQDKTRSKQNDASSSLQSRIIIITIITCRLEFYDALLSGGVGVPRRYLASARVAVFYRDLQDAIGRAQDCYCDGDEHHSYRHERRDHCGRAPERERRESESGRVHG